MHLPALSSSLLLALALIVPAARGAETDYSTILPGLQRMVLTEMAEWDIGGVAFALTDGSRIVHAQGLGEARDHHSVFRAGSISKVFTALLVMQLVEQGRLDLDRPLTAWAGTVLPHQPFPSAPEVTLRHLLTHRSGLPRESPVGGYLDLDEPSLAATCQSLASCVFATAPGAKVRYSNIAPALAGQIAALAAGNGGSFEEIHRARILQPLGMTHAAWTRASLSAGAPVVSRMRVADRDLTQGFHRTEAPVRDLGTLPAGNLYASAPDLARLNIAMSRVMRGDHVLLKPETWAEMWRPQWEATAGFGLGFAVGKFRGHRTVGHNGAVYGHSTLLLFLPETQLGVVFLANEDIVNARVSRMANHALALMLEAKTGERAPPMPPVGPAASRFHPAQMAGHYESQSYWTELESATTNRLAGSYSGQPCTITRLDSGRIVLNSRMHDDQELAFLWNADGRVTGFTAGSQVFRRVETPERSMPREWEKFCGAYGPEVIPVIIHAKYGNLYARTENMVDYRLTPVSRHVFGLPPGMYVDEQAVFLTETAGRVHAVDFASMLLRRWPER